MAFVRLISKLMEKRRQKGSEGQQTSQTGDGFIRGRSIDPADRPLVPKSWRLGRKGLAIALLAGLALVAAQPPIDQFWAMLLAIPALVWLIDGATARRAAIIGWVAGLSYFTGGLYWIAEAFLVDAAKTGWMAPFAVVLMGGGLALFWAFGFWLAARTRTRGLAFALAIAAGWSFAEYLRAHIFTGFPWALLAYGWSPTPIAQLLSVIGPHGLGFLTILLVALPVVVPQRAMVGTTILCVISMIVAGYWGGVRQQAADPFVPGSESRLTGPVVRLVQPNAQQDEKWREDMIPVFFDRLLKLSQTPATGRPDLVVWPETAVPWLVDENPELAARIAINAGVPVVLGARRIDYAHDGSASWRNALLLLGPEGRIIESYDKHHLVPFGEYLPFKELFSAVGLKALVAERGGFGAGDGPAIIHPPEHLKQVGIFAPEICYEMIFPHEMPTLKDRPEYILQITNDAWFGASAGPWQHLMQARMRAIETGLPVVRAANTGISAIIAPNGRILSALGLNESGVLQGTIPSPTPPTLYTRTGDLPLLLLVLICLAAAFILGRKKSNYS